MITFLNKKHSVFEIAFIGTYKKYLPDTIFGLTQFKTESCFENESFQNNCQNEHSLVLIFVQVYEGNKMAQTFEKCVHY